MKVLVVLRVGKLSEGAGSLRLVAQGSGGGGRVEGGSAGGGGLGSSRLRAGEALRGEHRGWPPVLLLLPPSLGKLQLWLMQISIALVEFVDRLEGQLRGEVEV